MIISPVITKDQHRQLNISPFVIIVIDDNSKRIEKTIRQLFHKLGYDVSFIERYTFVYLDKDEVCVNRSKLDFQFHQTLAKSNLIARVFPCQGSDTAFLTEELPDWLKGDELINTIGKFFDKLEESYYANVFTQMVWQERTSDFREFIGDWSELAKKFTQVRTEYHFHPFFFHAKGKPEFFWRIDQREMLAIDNYMANFMNLPSPTESRERIYDIFSIDKKDTDCIFPEIKMGIADDMLQRNRDINNWSEPFRIWKDDEQIKLILGNNKRTIAAALYAFVMAKNGHPVDYELDSKRGRCCLRSLIEVYFGESSIEDEKILVDKNRAKSDLKARLSNAASLLEVRWNVFRKEGRTSFLNIPPENIYIPEALLTVYHVWFDDNKMHE